MYHVRNARRPYGILVLCIQTDTARFVEQRSVKLVDNTKRRRLRWRSKLSTSKQQHSVPGAYNTKTTLARDLRRDAKLQSIAVLVQLPKHKDPFFSFKMRRHITERG